MIVQAQKFEPLRGLNIGIKHGFFMHKHSPGPVGGTEEAEGRSFQHLPRDLANLDALKNHV